MSKLNTFCPSCSPDTEVSHIILKDLKELLLKCGECGFIHKEKKARNVLVRVIVSKGEKSLHLQTMLSGKIKVGDELIVDDENTGEAYHVAVNSIEVGDKRPEIASAEEIKTIWSRAIDEIVVKIAVSRKETTQSFEMKVPGDQEFVIGIKLR